MSEVNELENTNAQTTKVSTTGFIDDMQTITEQPDNQMQIANIYFDKSSAITAADIARFLAKPVELGTGQFSIGDTSASFPTLYRAPYELIDNNIYWPKLQGFYGLRATMVLTLQVNSQRFQQGRYMLVYVPTGGARDPVRVDDWFQSHATTLVNRTQCHHVEIDINKETSVELRIPFNSSHDVYPLQYAPITTASTWGIFRIFPYSPLQTGSGSTTAKFTLWGHLEDVELVGQALPIARQSNSMVEAKSKGAGPIESTALKIKKAAGILSNVPVMSTYLKPVEWISDLVAKSANVFGWSAPANLDKQYRMETSYFSYATNVDKTDKTHPLSHSVKNSVQVLPGESMDNADELYIPHIASRFAYQDQFTWSDAAAEEDLLKRYNVGLYPVSGAPLTHVDGGVTLTDFTPAQWLGSRFEMYRGSIKMRFKIVKTDFHSGRLSFDFNPTARDYISPAMLDADSPFLHRQIVDIRDLSEFTLEIPYISHNPYLGTYRHGETHFGYLEVRVIDPLVAPATVSSSITLLMEHALCADAEFAGRNVLRRRNPAGLQIQSNSLVLGDKSCSGEQNNTSALSIGEKIVNMRTMLKRYEPMAFETDGDGTYGATYKPFNWGKIHCILPFAATRFAYGSRAIIPDLYSELANIFVYSRGAVRLKMTPHQGIAFDDGVAIQDAFSQTLIAFSAAKNTTAIVARTTYSIGIGPFLPTLPFPNCWDGVHQNTNMGNYVMTQSDRDRAIEVQVPQWLRQHSRNNVVHQCNTLVPYRSENTDETSKSYVYVYQIPVSGTQLDQMPSFNLDVWRAGADDTNFSCFVSIPPMEMFDHGVLA